jgi:hypothetical protein
MPGRINRDPGYPQFLEDYAQFAIDVCDYHLHCLLQDLAGPAPKGEEGGSPVTTFLFLHFLQASPTSSRKQTHVPVAVRQSLHSPLSLADRRSWSTACKEHAIMVARL